MRMRWFVSSSVVVAVLGLGCSDTDDGRVAGDSAVGETEIDGTQTIDAEVGDTALEATDSDSLETDGTVAETDTTSLDTDATETVDTREVTEETTTQVCQPGVGVCFDFFSRYVCDADGQGYGDPIACADDETCRNGVCQVRCPNDPKFGTYVGCEFWATDLPNYPDPALNPTPENLPWALVVSNPGAATVRVGFEMPPLFSFAPADDAVPPNESRVFQLPNINVQGTSLMPKGVHLTASGPVLVHQFNPWDNRFSNDASLLMPDPLLGTEYVIMSWPTGPLDLVQIPGFPVLANQNGYFTVIAAFPNTEVTFTVTAPVRASGSIPKLAAGESHTVRMNRGDVLSIQADPESLFGPMDITGSVVTANKPISVFGGHEEAVVGDPIEVEGEGGTTTRSPCCADHLEEQMFPLQLLSTAYVAVKSPPRGTTEIENDFWRIQAAADNVTITTVPATSANGTTLAKKGDFVEVKTSETFSISATGPIQVGQFLSSRDTTQDFTGDASMVMMVPEARYRKDYAFAVPDGYNDLWVAIVKRTGQEIIIDGVVVTSQFKAIGATGWEYGYLAVPAGYHVAESLQKFGLYVYGYSNAVSFSYVGGIAGPGE